MKAYAILDGGGVKGAALAGCLLAAEERGGFAPKVRKVTHFRFKRDF